MYEPGLPQYYFIWNSALLQLAEGNPSDTLPSDTMAPKKSAPKKAAPKKAAQKKAAPKKAATKTSDVPPPIALSAEEPDSQEADAKKAKLSADTKARKDLLDWTRNNSGQGKRNHENATQVLYVFQSLKNDAGLQTSFAKRFLSSGARRSGDFGFVKDWQESKSATSTNEDQVGERYQTRITYDCNGTYLVVSTTLDRHLST